MSNDENDLMFDYDCTIEEMELQQASSNYEKARKEIEIEINFLLDSYDRAMVEGEAIEALNISKKIEEILEEIPENTILIRTKGNENV